jgi:Archaeal S-adenosylmethionine synthetase
MIEPIKLFIVGRATEKFEGKNLVDKDKLKNRLRHWMMNQISHLKPEYFEVDLLIRSGSDDLISIFADNEQPPRANDTSLAVGYAPLSELGKISSGNKKNS